MSDKIKQNTLKLSILSSIILLIASYVMVLLNTLIAHQNEFSQKYLTLIAIIIFLIYEIIYLAISFKKNNITKIIFNSFCILASILLIIKYFNDAPRYFKDVNLTNFLVQSLIAFRIYLNLYLNNDLKNNNQKIFNIVIGLIMIGLFTTQLFEISNYSIKEFYVLGILFNINLIFAVFFNKAKSLSKNTFDKFYISMLFVYLIYYITSLVLVLTGNYKVTYLLIGQKILVLTLGLSFLYKSLSQTNIISKNNYSNIVITVILALMYITLNFVNPVFKDYNKYLLVLNLVFIIIFALSNFKKITKYFLITMLISFGLFITQIFFISDIKKYIFIIISILIIGLINIYNIYSLSNNNK